MQRFILGVVVVVVIFAFEHHLNSNQVRNTSFKIGVYLSLVLGFRTLCFGH